jgi:hypothetical protein
MQATPYLRYNILIHTTTREFTILFFFEVIVIPCASFEREWFADTIFVVPSRLVVFFKP